MVPGKLRDCWTRQSFFLNDELSCTKHYIHIDFQVSSQALKEYKDVPYDDVSIMAPCFLTDIDLAGAATPGNVLFGKTTWISGHQNTLPSNVTDVSSYDVMDELISYYLDITKFPSLETVVFAGSSAGGQMTQRYALLRKTHLLQDSRIQYWVASPGSLAWLTEERPFPNEACDGVDSWKYGLTDKLPSYTLEEIPRLNRRLLVERYLRRKIHYAFGDADNGPGDTRCQAVTQGASHIERGRKFLEMIDGLGGLRDGSTVDYLPGVTHSLTGLVLNEKSEERVCLDFLTYQISPCSPEYDELAIQNYLILPNLTTYLPTV